MQEPENRERRQLLKTGLGAGALLAASAIPGWMTPALAQGEELVPFTDVPEAFNPQPMRPGATYFLDTRRIDSFHTDGFYVVQHYGQPEVNPDSYRLKISGLVQNPIELSLAQLRQRQAVQQDIGFECGGNGARMFHGLVGNANWRGVRLRDLLQEAGVKPEGKEVVFFGADIGNEEIRGRQVEKAFARSLSVEDAMHADNLLAFEMNGEPLPLQHGRPLRLIVPGFYGVANVKWLTQIHVQDTRYMGRFMGRDYVTLKKENVGGQERWVENSVARMNLKSVITRVVRSGNEHRIEGFALNDGTPLRSVEISIDGGPWQQAQINPQASQYSWKRFSMAWTSPSAGEHTIVSRVTDANGNVQAPAGELPERVSYWEEFGQFSRRVQVAG
jgi:DMSO/TMAO reductase YedYZ molybdopterin-dependent catalytic subunit